MDKYYKYGFFIAILLILFLGYSWFAEMKHTSDLKIQESNLRKALIDSATYFRTKEGAWGEEKLTIQTDLSTLKDKNLQLSESQKALISEVDRQNKNGQTIAAALIKLQIEVSKFTDDKPVAETDSTVEFAANKPDLQYDVTITNVKPLPFKTPSLKLTNLTFPNTQTINFHWKDDRKEGYPVAFSVTNTNQYFKVIDIQSYAIPELKREKVKPTFWQKVGTFSKSTGGKIVFLGIGFVAGAVIVK